MTLPNPVPLLLFHGGSLPLWVGPSRNDQLSQIGSHRPKSAKDSLRYPLASVGNRQSLFPAPRRLVHKESVLHFSLAHTCLEDLPTRYDTDVLVFLQKRPLGDDPRNGIWTGY